MPKAAINFAYYLSLFWTEYEFCIGSVRQGHSVQTKYGNHLVFFP